MYAECRNGRKWVEISICFVFRSIHCCCCRLRQRWRWLCVETIREQTLPLAKLKLETRIRSHVDDDVAGVWDGNSSPHSVPMGAMESSSFFLRSYDKVTRQRRAREIERISVATMGGILNFSAFHNFLMPPFSWAHSRNWRFFRSRFCCCARILTIVPSRVWIIQIRAVRCARGRVRHISNTKRKKSALESSREWNSFT